MSASPDSIWRRMDGEGLRELRLYLLYLSLGARRSLSKLRRWAKELGIEVAAEELERLCQQFQWRKRAKAFDRDHIHDPTLSPMDRYREAIREWGDYQRLQIFQATLPRIEARLASDELSIRDLLQIAEYCEPALERPSSRQSTYYSQLYQLAQLLGIEEAFARQFGDDDEG